MVVELLIDLLGLIVLFTGQDGELVRLIDTTLHCFGIRLIQLLFESAVLYSVCLNLLWALASVVGIMVGITHKTF